MPGTKNYDCSLEIHSSQCIEESVSQEKGCKGDTDNDGYCVASDGIGCETPKKAKIGKFCYEDE